MAEAFAKANGEGKLKFVSAGTMLAKGVNMLLVQVIQVQGMNLSTKRLKLIDNQTALDADERIGYGLQRRGILYCTSAKNVADWRIEDPKSKLIEKTKKVRDGSEKSETSTVDIGRLNN
jgi:protein-tyrosine-phosphatase